MKGFLKKGGGEKSYYATAKKSVNFKKVSL